MKLDSKEEKELRALVKKESADRPVFLTQEEGAKLFEEIDALRKEHAAAVRYSERLVEKYKDDTISKSLEDMSSEAAGLRDLLSTANTMIQRATRLDCIHGMVIHTGSNTHVICEHCEILNHLVGMINKVEKGN